eukprot:gene7774-12248_t
MSKTINNEEYEAKDILFSSSKTVIQVAWSKTKNEEVLLKSSAEAFPSFTLIESFKKDFQFAKMLYQDHPEHFVNMIDMVEQKNGGITLVEESDGTGLQIYLQKNGKLTATEFLKIAIEMTKALYYAHTKQILHRDIKLANFILSEKTNRVKLIDFGLSVMVSRKSPSIACTAPT